jgi:hypothetical protein
MILQIGDRQWSSLGQRHGSKASKEITARKAHRARMPGLRRHRIDSGQTIRAAGPQNLFRALQRMRW